MNDLAVLQLLESIANELMGIDVEELTTAEKNIIRRIYNFRQSEQLPNREEFTQLFIKVCKGPR